MGKHSNSTEKDEGENRKLGGNTERGGGNSRGTRDGILVSERRSFI